MELIDYGEPVKYLGVRFDPWEGSLPPNYEKKIETWVKAIERFPMSASLRMELLTVYAIPRTYYEADLTDLSRGKLELADAVVRSTAKSWLSLGLSQ